MVLRLSGAAAKNLAVYLTALLKQGGPSKGKTTLKRMIPYFNAMAKKYGVMFVAVRDRKNPDGKCDIMFRLEDSARVNRIFDRLAISEHPDVAHIKSEIIRSREEKQNPQSARSRNPPPSARTSPIRSATGAAKPSVRKALQAIRNTRRAAPAKPPKAKQKSR